MKRSDRGGGHFFSFVFQQQGVCLASHGEHALHIGVHLLQQRPRCLVVHAGAAGGAELAGHRHHPGPDPRRRQALVGRRVCVAPRRGEPRQAVVLGIDDECKLVVRFDGESRPAALNSGEASVRLL